MIIAMAQYQLSQLLLIRKQPDLKVGKESMACIR